MSYIDGFIIPVPLNKKETYRAMAAEAAAVFKDHGATRVVECWGDDLPGGQTTDFMGAAQAKGGENVVFSWIVWPSREARDAGYKLVMADPRMKMEESTSFDGGRLIFGGFEVMLDTDQAAPAS